MTARAAKASVLFLCSGNSCRSQMAEAWVRAIHGDRIEARSAGIEPQGLDPRAVRVMAEAGVDMSGHRSKRLDTATEVAFDLVITVCDDANENCPVFPGGPRRMHAGFDDPPRLAAAATSEEEALGHYRRVRDEIRGWVETLPNALDPRDAGEADGGDPGRPGQNRTARAGPAAGTESPFRGDGGTTMEGTAPTRETERGMGVFERYLTVWVVLCIAAGIALGTVAPGVATYLDGLAIYVDDAPVVSIPIALCLFFMMYPIMVKIDFAEVVRAGKSARPVSLTLFVNWAVKPFTMYAISVFFLGTLFLGFIGPEAKDLVKMPFGLDLPVGAEYGAGRVILADGVRMLEVPLWRSYLAGCILLGIAPCTAMVLVWGYLAKGNDGHTLVMVAINSLTMLVLYGVLGGFLLGVGRLPVPWQALLLSIGIYVALPLVAGYLSRKWIIAARGETWFRERFLHVLTPVTIIALLITLVLLFSFKGEVILSNPLTILWIAIPLFLQTMLIFWMTYGAARMLKLTYRDAAPSAMIGASNHFEVAIATATALFGLSSGAALATVVGVLIEVPVMLMLVKICLRTQRWFAGRAPGRTPEA